MLLPPSASTPQIDAAPEGADFRQMLDTIWTGKWVVLTFVAIGLAIGYLVVLRSEPVYQAKGLIQVERQEDSLSATANKISDLVGAKPPEAPAEIAIIKSRMVLGPIAAALNLNTYVAPLYLTAIGEAISRSRASLGQPAKPPFGLTRLDRYSWGGERIEVSSIEVPATWIGRGLFIEATADGFKLLADGRVVLEGKEGERARAQTPDGEVSIFVRDIRARPGTQFFLSRRAEQIAYDDLAGRLKIVEEPTESGILIIQAYANSPEFAANIVNDVQEAYLRQNLERKSSQAEQSLTFLKNQLPDIKTRVDEAQSKLNAYQLKSGTIDIQKETEVVLDRSVELETERLNLVREREAALQRFTENHPAVTTLDEQIRLVAKDQNSLRKQAFSLPETQQEILGLVRDVEVNVQLYTALLNSAQQLQVAKAGTVGNVRIIDRALPPLYPIKPNKRNIMLAAFVAGLLAGVGAVFGLRLSLKGVDKPEDVERVLGLSTYAAIPYSIGQNKLMSRLRSKNEPGQMLAIADSSDLAIEALRSLRTSLHFAMLEARNNVVAFTGPSENLGKSFVTINLGAILAQTGKRVLVIDADMRRGSLHRLVAVSQKPGLSDYIAAAADDVLVINKTLIEGLHFIACGMRPPNPAEILSSERFALFLEHLSKLYDYVLIDTPPVMPVTDAAIIGRLAGTTLLVLKSAEHPMRIIVETVKRLTNSGAHVSGTVFNQVGKRMGSYGYGSYGSNYGYKTEAYKTHK